MWGSTIIITSVSHEICKPNVQQLCHMTLKSVFCGFKWITLEHVHGSPVLSEQGARSYLFCWGENGVQ